MKRINKTVKRLVCMTLILASLLGFAVPGNAASAKNSWGDANIVGEYREDGDWSSWSSWTLNVLVSKKLKRTEFTGKPYVAETEVRSRTCYIRKDGKIDTIWNIFVALSGGYRETTKQYRFRTRILYWHNDTDLPTGLAALAYGEKRATLYNELNLIRYYRSFLWGYSWAVGQLKSEVHSIVVSTFPSYIKQTYDVYSLAQSSKTMVEYLNKNM